MTASQEAVTPANAGVQNGLFILDSGACPGPDPGFAGMTKTLFSDSLLDHQKLSGFIFR
jgi:hypothetical protein